MEYIPKDKIIWKRVKYLKIPWQVTDEEAEWLYEFWLNEPLASWDVFSVWEIETILSMREHLKKGDILFDIGSEQGWLNLAYANIVGPENMVLIEPTPEFWPNIRALWEKNFDVQPKAFYDGLFSDKTTEARKKIFSRWPVSSEGDLIDRNSYKFIHEHGDVIPQIKIDDFVKGIGIVPDALTMDTEGAELLILKGAERTLKENNVKVWVSQHEDMALRDYGVQDGEIEAFMHSLGYYGQFLAKDHEKHMLYLKYGG